jgi:DNA-binding CsgD family transcriptional regulator
LNRLDKAKNAFSHYTKADGLASDMILGILEDRSGDLWLATNDGLPRFSPRTRQFRNYDEADGLQGREFDSGACLRSRSGEIVLSPRDQLFSFEFSALDYTAPEKNRYAYTLEELTDDWIQTDSRRRLASFSRLPPGRYVFRVRGSNSDGIWNDQEASRVIRVRAPWWRTGWFLSLLAAAAALLAYEWNRTRIRRRARRVRTAAAMEQLFDQCATSPREREIAMLLLKGLNNKEIGEKLFIELSTVKIHIHHVLGKLGVRNRTQLIRLFQNLHINP